MITDRVIEGCIEDVYSISGTALVVADVTGRVIAHTGSISLPDRDKVYQGNG